MCTGVWEHTASQRNNKYYTVRHVEPQHRSSKRFPEETDPRNGLSWGGLKGTEGVSYAKAGESKGRDIRQRNRSSSLKMWHEPQN